MSRLLSCWKRKPYQPCQEEPEHSSATATKAKMADDSKKSKNSNEAAAALKAAAPAFLLRVQNGGSRRHEAEARTDECWLVADIGGGGGCDPADEARLLANRRTTFDALLGLINALRRTANCPDLLPSSVLCRVAQTTWQRRSQEQHGFASLPDCCVNQAYPDRDCTKGTGIGLVHDCLAYCDVPGHCRKDLPAAAVHYWSTNGSFSSDKAKPASKPLEQYPPKGSDAWLQMDDSRHMFKSILLDKETSCIGLYFKKAKTGLESAAWAYCVIAVFE